MKINHEPIRYNLYINYTHYNFAKIEEIYMRPYYESEMEIVYRLILWDSDGMIYYMMCYESLVDAYNSLINFGYKDSDVEVIKEEIKEFNLSSALLFFK